MGQAQSQPQCVMFDQIPEGDFGAGGVSCKCGYNAEKGAQYGVRFCPHRAAERLDAQPSEPEMNISGRDASTLMSHLPAVNPLAQLDLQQRLGQMNPVRWKGNNSFDPRGNARIMGSTVITQEPPYLKNSRAIDSYIDEQQLKAEVNRGPRQVNFI